MADTEKNIQKKEKTSYTKEQILASVRFNSRKDLADAVLAGDKKYTMEEAEKRMEQYLKGKVR